MSQVGEGQVEASEHWGRFDWGRFGSIGELKFREHCGLHGVELHGDELGMMAKWLAVGGLGETGSVRKYKRSQI